MGADMTIAEFPVFDLSDERKARIMASLDQEKFDEFEDWGTDQDALATLLENLSSFASEAKYHRQSVHINVLGDNGKPMRVMITGGMTYGEAPTDLYEEISLFHHFCSKRSLTLMNSYAQKDYQRSKGSPQSTKRRLKKSPKPTVCA